MYVDITHHNTARVFPFFLTARFFWIDKVFFLAFHYGYEIMSKYAHDAQTCFTSYCKNHKWREKIDEHERNMESLIQLHSLIWAWGLLTQTKLSYCQIPRHSSISISRLDFLMKGDPEASAV